MGKGRAHLCRYQDAGRAESPSPSTPSVPVSAAEGRLWVMGPTETLKDHLQKRNSPQHLGDLLPFPLAWAQLGAADPG